jgi:PAS domain S-box-containing protein
MNLKSKLIVAGGIALLTLSTVAALSYHWTLHEDADQRWVAHTHMVLEKLGLLLRDVISEKMGQQDYGLTGKTPQLSSPAPALARVVGDLNEIAALTSDNPRQQQSLRQLRLLLATELSGAPVHQPRLDSETAKPFDRTLEASLEQVGSQIGAMEQEENRLLAQRLKAAQASSRRMKITIVLGDALAVLFVGVGAYAIHQEMSRRSQAEQNLRESEERFRLMATRVKEYAILMLDPGGRISSWNAGAERIKGYSAEEIIGQHFSRFYPAADIAQGKPDYELKMAAQQGQFEDEGWRVRKDGSRFWANVVITAMRDDAGRLRGFCKVSRDMTERRRAEEEIKRQNAQLDAANRELDAFSYSVAHDLRAPLRAIDGFSSAALEDCKDQISAEGKLYLERVRAGAVRMAHLIDDLLRLSRISRQQMGRSEVDLSGLAQEVVSQLRVTSPDRQVRFTITPEISVTADRDLLRIVLENLLGNAWKFTSKEPQAQIELGMQNGDGQRIFFVRDNGPGFDMRYADKLFGVFQRLHRDSEFPGTGVGLATVQRIIQRHGGRIWAKAAVGEGATFYFAL